MTATALRRFPLWPLALLGGVAVVLAVAVRLGVPRMLRPARQPAGRGPIARRDGALEIPATVHAAAFNRRLLGMPGYHLIVWQGGRAAPAALFQAAASDVQVLDALAALGVRPGAGLPMAAWDERDDPHSHAPDRAIDGPEIELLVRVPGRPAPPPLRDVLEDAEGRAFERRPGGRRANRPRWQSGRTGRLYPCPG